MHEELSFWWRVHCGCEAAGAMALAKGLEGKIMSIAQSVKDHLPFLRRYARALTGSQVSGDKYVEAAP